MKEADDLRMPLRNVRSLLEDVSLTGKEVGLGYEPGRPRRDHGPASHYIPNLAALALTDVDGPRERPRRSDALWHRKAQRSAWSIKDLRWLRRARKFHRAS